MRWLRARGGLSFYERFAKLAHRQNFGAKPANRHNLITYVIQFISWIRPSVDRWYTGVLLLILTNESSTSLRALWS